MIRFIGAARATARTPVRNRTAAPTLSLADALCGGRHARNRNPVDGAAGVRLDTVAQPGDGRKSHEPALTMAELTLSGAFDASDCLRVIGYLMEALRLSDASRPLGTGLCSKSRRANRRSDPGARATKLISGSGLYNGGHFTDVPNAGVVAVVPVDNLLGQRGP